MSDRSKIMDGAGAVLDNHYFVRDGSFWACRNDCGVQVPFPSSMPDTATLGPCKPRTWGSGAAPVTTGYAYPAVERRPPADRLPNGYQLDGAGRSVLDYPCDGDDGCGAAVGERCRDTRSAMRSTLRPHFSRRQLPASESGETR